jgi:hypothetical protein
MNGMCHYAGEPAACGPIRASLKFHNEAVVAKPHSCKCIAMENQNFQYLSDHSRSIQVFSRGLMYIRLFCLRKRSSSAGSESRRKLYAAAAFMERCIAKYKKRIS